MSLCRLTGRPRGRGSSSRTVAGWILRTQREMAMGVARWPAASAPLLAMVWPSSRREVTESRASAMHA